MQREAIGSDKLTKSQEAIRGMLSKFLQIINKQRNKR